MKKKLLTLVMVLTMTAMVLTGCGEKEETKGDVKASVEESKEEEKEESKEESKEDAKEESKEESKEAEASSEEVVEVSEEVEESIEDVEESTEEVIESTEEEVIESTEEVTETEEEETDVEDTNANKGPIDYNEFFKRSDIISENVKITCAAEAEGVTFDLVVESAGDNARMYYDFGTLVFDMYVTKEKIYAFYEMEGESQWVWAPVESEDDAESIMSMSDTGLMDPETIESINYYGVMDDNGVIMDMVEVVANDGTTALYYVNCETEKVVKCEMDQDGITMVMNFEEIDSIEVPAEAESLATETTTEEVVMLMLGVVLGGAGAFE